MKNFQCRQCGSVRIKAVPIVPPDDLLTSALKMVFANPILRFGLMNRTEFFKMKCMECGYIQIERHSLHDVFDIVTFDDNL